MLVLGWQVSWQDCESGETRGTTRAALTSAAWGPGPELKSDEFAIVVPPVKKLTLKLQTVTQFGLSLPWLLRILGILPNIFQSLTED